jgi:hypothetical protein
MGTIYYWPGRTYEELKNADTEGVLLGYDEV